MDPWVSPRAMMVHPFGVLHWFKGALLTVGLLMDELGSVAQDCDLTLGELSSVLNLKIYEQGARLVLSSTGCRP
ncbi:MAG: hypothetical protein QGH29_03570 [Kiritimatiellia bacterium]|nr:hypothetical protein [Kiritimatiellia bacterium]